MENANWHDKIRLGMIEKSKLYQPYERVYQYGYYDGYQIGTKQKDELLKALKEIAKGGGRYDMDMLKHASNTIEDMITLAKTAIKNSTK